MALLIIAGYAFWSLAWLLALAVEWARARRADRMVLYFVVWLSGGVVFAAARLMLT